jgi:predicted nucleic acid-binding protein
VTGWLLDTNVLSELRRPRPEPKVVAFIKAQPLDALYLSMVTLAEIRFGIERLADAGRRAELNDWLSHKVRPMFDGRILPVTEDIMLKWRLMDLQSLQEIRTNTTRQMYRFSIRGIDTSALTTKFAILRARGEIGTSHGHVR